LKVDVDFMGDIIVHLAEPSLTTLKTHTGARNRHRLTEIFQTAVKRDRQHVELGRQQRKLDNKNRGNRGGDGKKRLREPDGEDFVGHVHSPLTELIEE
jgi:hypothetical protein